MRELGAAAAAAAAEGGGRRGAYMVVTVERCGSWRWWAEQG